MNIGKVSYYARRTHRILLLVIVVIGLIMMITGATMKYPLLIPIDPIQARILHNSVSTVFSFVFFGMMLTGLIMYITPWIIKRSQKPTTQPPLSN